jgi:colanic acid biosynthesis glycosyl transferase WcaI
LATGLAARGHEVEVISELPSHPQGVRYPGFAARPVQRRELEGCRVSYVWASASPSKRPLSRLAAYGTYAASAVVAGALARRPDIIFASSPPLSVGLVGELIARRHRVPWVLDVRDLWPQVAAELGSVKPGRALSTAMALERHLYADAAGVTVASEGFREHVTRYARPDAVMVLPNGTTRQWLEVGEAPADRAAAGLPDGVFVWTYAGNVGLSQGLDTAVAAARLLGPGYRLLIVGDGASRPRLKEAAVGAEDGSVEFRDPIPVEEAARLMRASDALLVSLDDGEALGRTVPVKLFDSAAVGRPVIVAAPGEPRRIAERTGAGLPVRPGDPEALAVAVRRLAGEPELRGELAAAGRAFAAENLRETGILRLESFLSERIGG